MLNTSTLNTLYWILIPSTCNSYSPHSRSSTLRFTTLKLMTLYPQTSTPNSSLSRLSPPRYQKTYPLDSTSPQSYILNSTSLNQQPQD
ncbi:hypothetical protein AYI69_g9860 [Smittium culicis]|uniref:Uncharacterized protein n=1 Tax=Smittium culicis TaxID=133412 RepID=A0A1R1X9P7_9FUNG|nr:hypothetical protein AYI69_g9860 [Smittium culicis]